MAFVWVMRECKRGGFRSYGEVLREAPKKAKGTSKRKVSRKVKPVEQEQLKEAA